MHGKSSTLGNELLPLTCRRKNTATVIESAADPRCEIVSVWKRLPAIEIAGGVSGLFPNAH